MRHQCLRYKSFHLSYNPSTTVSQVAHGCPWIAGVCLVCVRIFPAHSKVLQLIKYTSTLCNVLYCAKINRDKANGNYDKYLDYADDRHPDFKMVL